jgi:ferrochelatase
MPSWKPPDVLVASYHGVPKRYLMEGDPYHCQCQKTSRLLKERLGWDDTEIVTTFQSRFGPEEWLKPYTVEEVARLAEQGKKRIAVIAPAFSADCIETLEEINEEIRESFEEAGGEEFGETTRIHLHPLPQRRRRAYRPHARSRNRSRVLNGNAGPHKYRRQHSHFPL